MVNAHSTLDRFYKLGLGLLAWVTLGWLMLKAGDYLLGIVVLFGISLLLTYLLLAPVNLMENALYRLFQLGMQVEKLRFALIRLPKALPRVLAILSVYLVFALMVMMVSVRFVPVAFNQLNQFSGEFPRYIHQAEDWVLNQNFTQNYFHQEVEALRNRGELTKPQVQSIEQETQQVQKKTGTNGDTKLSPTEKQVIREKLFGTSQQLNQFFKEHIGATFDNLIKVVSTTLTGFVYALTGLVLIFYFLLDGPYLKKGFLHMFPKDMRLSADYLLSNMHLALFGFIKGQVMLGIATGIYMIIIYTLFDVPYAFFLGAFFAIAEILPVVGTWLGFTPGIIVLLFINPVKLLFVMGCVYIYQVLKDNIVAPKVLGESVGLHPVIVIVSLLVCAKVAGLVGVLFAIPLASMINVVLRFLQEKDLEPTSR